jgi:hypothetical protein
MYSKETFIYLDLIQTKNERKNNRNNRIDIRTRINHHTGNINNILDIQRSFLNSNLPNSNLTKQIWS